MIEERRYSKRELATKRFAECCTFVIGKASVPDASVIRE